MARVIDKGTHRVGREFLSRIRTKEYLERLQLLESGVEPQGIGFGGENNRHSIVDRGHEVIRLLGDDRTGFERFPSCGLPVLP
jgi:hypothetical protein